MTADPYKWRRRLGRFVIGRKFREDWQQGVMITQRKVLIREARVDWSTDVVHYIGQADFFDVVEEGAEVPLYTVIVHQLIEAHRVRPVDVTFERATTPGAWLEHREAQAVRDGVALSSISHPGTNADFSGPEGTPTDLERAKNVSEILQVLDQVWYQHDDPQVEAAFKRVCAAKEVYYRA